MIVIGMSNASRILREHTIFSKVFSELLQHYLVIGKHLRHDHNNENFRHSLNLCDSFVSRVIRAWMVYLQTMVSLVEDTNLQTIYQAVLAQCQLIQQALPRDQIPENIYDQCSGESMCNLERGTINRCMIAGDVLNGMVMSMHETNTKRSEVMPDVFDVIELNIYFIVYEMTSILADLRDAFKKHVPSNDLGIRFMDVTAKKMHLALTRRGLANPYGEFEKL